MYFENPNFIRSLLVKCRPNGDVEASVREANGCAGDKNAEVAAARMLYLQRSIAGLASGIQFNVAFFVEIPLRRS